MKNDTEIVFCPPYNACIYIHMHAYMYIFLMFQPAHLFISHPNKCNLSCSVMKLEIFK